MTSQLMPRKKRSYSLDIQVIEGLLEIARKTGQSANKYLEGLLFEHLKEKGVLDSDAEPSPNKWGGDRSKPSEDNSDD